MCPMEVVLVKNLKLQNGKHQILLVIFSTIISEKIAPSNFFTPFPFNLAPSVFHTVLHIILFKSKLQPQCLAMYFQMFVFTARSSFASAVLGIVIQSVPTSVCLSATHVLCDETKEYIADNQTPHKRVITLVFRQQQRLVGDVQFYLKFCAKIDQPL